MQAVMLYDGHCVLCRGTLQAVRRLDWLNRVEALDAQDFANVQERYPELNYDDLMGSIHVVKPNGDLIIGFFAVRYLGRFLPLAWLLLPLLYLPGMNWLGPRLYNWVARRRYNINRFFGQPVCEDGYCNLH